jgi:gamma-glutamylcyclotransferase (GGCT)/AIG2-like uncharacterized protein YtfP
MPRLAVNIANLEGEVYRIDNATLAELDALRTRGGEYARQLIQTPYGSAWMYVYQRPVDGLTIIMLSSMMLIVGNLIADLLYRFADPRIRTLR